MNPYEERSRALTALGYGDYGLYLRSDLWFSIRERVLRRQPRCVCCGRPAEQVHHTAYDEATLAGTDTRALLSVCVRCHDRAEAHGKPRGVERLAVATELLLTTPRWLGRLVKTPAYKALTKRQKKRHRHGLKSEARAAIKAAHDDRVIAQAAEAVTRAAERQRAHAERSQAPRPAVPAPRLVRRSTGRV